MLTAQGKKTGVIHYAGEFPSDGVICSHPRRVQLLAENFLTSPRLVSENRGYQVYVGDYKKRPLFVANVGIGAASAAILIEELIVLGAKNIIRLGTADHEVIAEEEGRLYLVTETVGLYGLAAAYGFADSEAGRAFCSSPELTQQIADAARRLEFKDVASVKAHHVEAYYVHRNPQRFAADAHRASAQARRWETEDYRVCDMESGALFMLGELRSVRTACVLQAIRKHVYGYEMQDKQHEALLHAKSAKLVLESF